MINIVQAKEEHIPILIPLLDKYRVFYGQRSDKQAAQSFLENRMKNKDSVIFIAFYEGSPAGFTQLYSSFSSVSLKPIFILNDLYWFKFILVKNVIIMFLYSLFGATDSILNSLHHCSN